MGYLRQKETQLSKFYNTGAILVHSNSALKKHYDDVITSIQQLSILPFHLDLTFIREKALSDSRFKSHEMIGSAEGMVLSPANQKEGLDSPTNESIARARSSVLDFSASKALNWLANAALPKKQNSLDTDLSASRSKSHDTLEFTNQKVESDIPANQMPGLSHKNQYEHLSEVRKATYMDAKVSTIDCDPIISPSESLRSSVSSQAGFTSLFSNMAARLGDNPINQSLTQSMTSSASSLVTRLTGIKIGSTSSSSSSSPQKTYKKGVTEYNFENADASTGKVQNENENIGDSEKETDVCEVVMREKKVNTENDGRRDAKRVSFDIVNLFDKLLLPAAKPDKKEAKPVSKIPVPTTRWSWNFGMPKFGSANESVVKTIPKASTDSDLKSKSSPLKHNQSNKRIVAKSDSPSHKIDHFPKRGGKSDSDLSKSAKGGKSHKSSSKVPAPPKPPRLVQSVPSAERKSVTSHAGRKNTATL